MPFIDIEDVRLFYRLEGLANRPVLVLSHSLGCDSGMWAPQMPHLLERLQVLSYDTRGHGASAAPQGDYAVEQLGRDVLGLADALNIQTFAFCGLSMGGAIGQWLALHAPSRLNSLILASTSPRFAAPDMWETRRRAVHEGGMAAIAEATMQRFFAPGMLETDPYAQSVQRVFLATDVEGYRACCAALRDFDLTRELGKIALPTLVIGGNNDPSTPWEEHSAVLAREIPEAKTLRLASAHLSNLGQPQAFTKAVLDFLELMS